MKMNVFTLVTIGVVALVFFLTGSSFMFLLSLVVLVIYCLVEVGGGEHKHEEHHHHEEQKGRSCDPGGNGASMENVAGTLGYMINAFGTIAGKVIKGAFFMKDKPEKKKDEPQKIELTVKNR